LCTGAGLDAQDRTLQLIRRDVEQAIGPLLHIADALMQVDQQRFATQLFHLVVEQQRDRAGRAGDLTLAHATHEQIPFPLRQLVARVEVSPETEIDGTQ